MKYKLYTTSLKAWDAMLAAIESAKKSIYLEMYIFLGDTTESHDFIGQLIRKAKEGAKVIIVADSFGSSELKKESIESLRQAGVEFIFFSTWLRHIHRKILIIDEEIAFIGGVNIGKSFAEWNDLQLNLRGRIVKALLKSFAYTYEMAGGKNLRILKFRDKSLGKKLRTWLLEHRPNKNIYALKDVYIEKIPQAKKSIKIVTPYFGPPRWLVALLDEARKRNVSIEIYLPRKTDFPLVSRIHLRYMCNLSPLGIRFFLLNKMNHAKILLLDDEESFVGSSNFDFLSLNILSEAGVFSKQKKLAVELKEIIENWKKESDEFVPQKFKMKFLDYIILALAKVIFPLL